MPVTYSGPLNTGQRKNNGGIRIFCKMLRDAAGTGIMTKLVFQRDCNTMLTLKYKLQVQTVFQAVKLSDFPDQTYIS